MREPVLPPLPGDGSLHFEKRKTGFISAANCIANHPRQLLTIISVGR